MEEELRRSSDQVEEKENELKEKKFERLLSYLCLSHRFEMSRLLFELSRVCHILLTLNHLTYKIGGRSYFDTSLMFRVQCLPFWCSASKTKIWESSGGTRAFYPTINITCDIPNSFARFHCCPVGCLHASRHYWSVKLF